jgi:hypothetical protein
VSERRTEPAPAVYRDQHNIAAAGSLYNFWPDYPSKVLIVINYFALQYIMRNGNL